MCDYRSMSHTVRRAVTSNSRDLKKEIGWVNGAVQWRTWFDRMNSIDLLLI